MTSKELENYTPQELEFIIDEEAKDIFPCELDFINNVNNEHLANKREVLKFVGQNFSATFPDGEYVTRKMDEYEKTTLRGEYCQLVENLLPERKRQLEEALEEAKRLKKEAEELYSLTLQEINIMAAEVKQGKVEARLKSTDTFCMALAGYYLYYTWSEPRQVFVLAKATKANDASLWSSDEKNREMLREIFGYEFPENETPEQTDEIDAF